MMMMMMMMMVVVVVVIMMMMMVIMMMIVLPYLSVCMFSILCFQFCVFNIITIIVLIQQQKIHTGIC